MKRHLKGSPVKGSALALLLLLAALILGVTAVSAAAPTLSIDAAANVEITRAHLSGEVSVPAEGPETYWGFEYAKEGSGEWSGFPSSGTLAPGESQTVAIDLSGLHASRKYEARLVAENFSDPRAESDIVKFKTDPAPVEPIPAVLPATEVAYTSAKISGTVDPEGGNQEAGGAYVPIHWSLYARDKTVEGEFEERASGEIKSGAGAESPDPVEVGPTELSGLVPGHTYAYFFRVAWAGEERESGEGPGEFTALAVTAPTVTIDPITTFTATSAHFSGQVDPGGTAPAFDSAWHFECEPACPGLQGGTVHGGEGDTEVTNEAGGPEGLQPNTTYKVKLVASNLGGTAEASESGGQAVEFRTPTTAPTIATGTNTPQTDGSVLVRAYINPRNSPVSECKIEYGLTNAYGTQAPCDSAHPGQSQVQEIAVGELDNGPGTGEFKLSFAGQITADIHFGASAQVLQSALRALPAIGPEGASVRELTSANSNVHHYLISFGGPLSNQSLEPVQILPGSEPLTGITESVVIQAGGIGKPTLTTAGLSGLQAGATYHFRFLAANAGGPSASQDSTFRVPSVEVEGCPNQTLRAEQHAAYLPDCRAYEMASPVNKNGGDVLPLSARTRVATDGSAVGFSSLRGFANPASASVTADYLSLRDPSGGATGWVTHPISPPQDALTFVGATKFVEPAFWGEFSENLDRGIFRAYSPLTADPDVANTFNLYLRDDIRQPGAGSYQLITACPACSAPFPPVSNPQTLHEQSSLVGASTDFSHIVFESDLPLTVDSTADTETLTNNLFESEDGTVRLVGLVPPPGEEECGSGSLPICEAAPFSQSGIGAFNTTYTPHTVSADGSRVEFTVPEGNCSSISGAQDCGQLYIRIDHQRTIHLNASEKTNGAGPGGGDPNGQQPATYWDASTDGSRVYFTTNQALTDDAPVNQDHILYRYDLNAPAGHRLTLISADREPLDGISDSTSGVLGASADAGTVYFLGNRFSQSAPGASVEASVKGVKIYRWHEGQLEYIGATDESEQINTNSNWVARPKVSRVSPDGNALLFDSASGSGLTGYESECQGNDTASATCQELYLFNTSTHSLQCVSCNPSGAPGRSDATDVTVGERGAAVTTYHLNHPLSDDGRFVFFNTADSLLPADTNGVGDAYEYDALTNRVHLLSSGTAATASVFMDASPDGHDAFIDTEQGLLGWDTDGGNLDLYDARVDGGFPEPPPRPAACSLEQCRAPAALPPVPSPASTAGLIAPPNQKPHRQKHKPHHHPHRKHHPHHTHGSSRK